MARVRFTLIRATSFMPEIIFILLVVIGQAGAFIYLLGRKLMNTPHGSLRSVASILLLAMLFGIPFSALFVLHQRGILIELAHFRGPRVAVWLIVAYVAVVLIAIGRFLWVSLVTLPRRKRPPMVTSANRTIFCYGVEESKGAGPAQPTRTLNPLARLNCRFDLEVNEFVLSPPGLPRAFDGFCIVHLSDIHVARHEPEGWHDFIVTMVERLRPDLIVITGDFLAYADDLVCFERILPRLRAPHGVWAIRGNHDFWEAADEVRDALARAGIGLLANRRTEIRRDDAVFDLVGIESPWTPSCEAWQGLINPSSPQRLTIVLTHTPDNAPVVARLGATLMLAGHTHGGQIRFPLIGSLIVPSRYGKRYDEGWFAVGSLALYVNRGVGSFSPDMRLACRPEIARLILRADIANESAGQSSR